MQDSQNKKPTQESGTRVMLPSIFSALTRIANASDPLKLAINGISYKPCISLFNLTEAIVTDPDVRHWTDTPRHRCVPFCPSLHRPQVSDGFLVKRTTIHSAHWRLSSCAQPVSQVVNHAATQVQKWDGSGRIQDSEDVWEDGRSAVRVYCKTDGGVYFGLRTFDADF